MSDGVALRNIFLVGLVLGYIREISKRGAFQPFTCATCVLMIIRADVELYLFTYLFYNHFTLRCKYLIFLCLPKLTNHFGWSSFGLCKENKKKEEHFRYLLVLVVWY